MKMSLDLRGSLPFGFAVLLATSCSDASSKPGAPSGPADASSHGIERIAIEANSFVFEARAAGPEGGELVLLLHGFAETSHVFRHQMPALAKAGFRVVAPDQRGYSPRARPREVAAYAMAELRADVLAIADALGRDRFHLAGHDLGATVAWAVAATAPERLVTLGALSVPHTDAWSDELAISGSCQYQASAYFDFFLTAEAADRFLEGDAELLRGIFDGVPEADVRTHLEVVQSREAMDAAFNWYRANIQDRNFTTPRLGAIRVPTLYAWGDADPYLCRETAERTRAFVTADYRFEVIAGANHFVPETAPDAVTSLLAAHLAAFR